MCVKTAVNTKRQKIDQIKRLMDREREREISHAVRERKTQKESMTEMSYKR